MLSNRCSAIYKTVLHVNRYAKYLIYSLLSVTRMSSIRDSANITLIYDIIFKNIIELLFGRAHHFFLISLGLTKDYGKCIYRWNLPARLDVVGEYRTYIYYNYESFS
jgi:hypothetical protein